VPLPALVTVNHPALLAAVHAQPEAAATENAPLEPGDATDTVVGDSV
jgi:hypothetical protein